MGWSKTPATDQTTGKFKLLLYAWTTIELELSVTAQTTGKSKLPVTAQTTASYVPVTGLTIGKCKTHLTAQTIGKIHLQWSFTYLDQFRVEMGQCHQYFGIKTILVECHDNNIDSILFYRAYFITLIYLT